MKHLLVHISSLRKKENIIPLIIVMVSLLIGLSIIHDPFNTRQENNLLVLSEQEIDIFSEKVYQACSSGNSNDKQDCYADILKKMTSTSGLRTSIAVLNALQDKDSFARSCHIVSHRMADAAYKLDPRDFYNMLDTVDVSSCGGGFLHGILGAYADANPDLVINGAFGESICKNGSEYRQNSCMHFVGHMFIMDTIGDIEQALPRCEDVRESLRFNCYDGIFMEDHQKLMLADHGLAPLPTLGDDYIKKLESRCLASSGVVGTACWTEMAEMYAHTYRYDPALIFSHCSKAQSKEYIKACYLKGVNALAIYPGFDTEAKLLSLCSPYNKTPTHYQCVYTLLSALIYNSPKFTPRAVTYCDAEDPSFKDRCYFLIVDRLKAVVQDIKTRTTYCGKLPEKHRGVCTN